ncbi:MAG TPA: histidine phosphatase family protein [Anaeromyxobacter sp.]
MELLVVRHAVAQEREVFAKTGEDDTRRPLTREGRRKFVKGARGLRKLVPRVDLLATSELVRALETAELLEAGYGELRTARLAELAPDADPRALLRWLRAQRRRKVVAIVGHEPHLSRAVAYLLTGQPSGFVRLEKGGACLLAWEGAPAAGRAELRWLLEARQLRRLGR